MLITDPQMGRKKEDLQLFFPYYQVTQSRHKTVLHKNLKMNLLRDNEVDP